MTALNPVAKRGIFGVRADGGDLKGVINSLGKAFEEFKAENDARLKEIEKKGYADPVLSEKIDKINAEMSELSAMKKQLENFENIIARGNYGGGQVTELDAARAEHAQAFDKFFRKGVDAGLADLEVKAALKTSSDPDGGWTVPVEIERGIDRVVETVSAMRRLATVMQISTDTYKKLVNVGGASSGWVGETGSRTETNTPQLKEIILNTKELYANPAATQAILDDSAIDIGQWIAGEVVIEFAEQESDAFVNGNGVEKPKGILGYTKVANSSYAWGKTGFIASGAAAALTDPDALISLQHALKAQYRNGAAWLMADSTFETIRKLKDGNDQYLWRPGLTEGAPDMLLGKPVEIDDNMPAIAANVYPIAFANFKRAYLIIDRVGVRVLRDPFTNKPYVHFYTTKRVGGGLVMYEAIKLMKISV